VVTFVPLEDKCAKIGIDMERCRARLEKVLGKYNKGELPDVATSLGVEIPSGARGKKEMVSLIAASCVRKGIKPSEVLELELTRKSHLFLPIHKS